MDEDEKEDGADRCIKYSWNSVSATEKTSVYDEVQHFDFPIGILPKGVIGYELNSKTGEFSVYLNGSCRRSGDNLQFSVGFTSANFPIRSFEKCPRCECGLHCAHEYDGELREKLLVSSS
ncbi:hypothetical protein CQW23_13783 [Capsicum baccatum]|uniref:Uncharacterized protein n=1 Tax=Capsicum baccatum TaxID=33114 RepID=A0A2G2WHA2_CAPBA|nr:hypothetical protein CQW23_13783 [Capsicum baccatum]